MRQLESAGTTFVLQLGSERVRHMMDGKTVLARLCSNMRTCKPAAEWDLLRSGGQGRWRVTSRRYPTIQAQSHPTEFRKIEVLNLSGCMDPKAANYKSYYVHRDDKQ